MDVLALILLRIREGGRNLKDIPGRTGSQMTGILAEFYSLRLLIPLVAQVIQINSDYFLKKQ